MNDQRSLRYFLGGNTGGGFYSLYDSFVSLDDGNFLWIIKGGPGCGKSSFMKMIGAAAERAGLDVEYALCSGDPDSLDGVFIPDLKIAYTDGTSPHIADTHFAAADSAYLDLGIFYDLEAIAEHRDLLSRLYGQLRFSYDKTYALMHAAGALKENWQTQLICQSDKALALERAKGIAVREFGKRRHENGKITRRFLSAYTCHGLCALTDTMQTLCRRFYVFDNRLHLGEACLDDIAAAAAEAGQDVIVCPNPLLPEHAEAVLIPAMSLGFVTSDSPLNQLADARHIRLDALIGNTQMRSLRPEIRLSERLSASLITEALASLAQAKHVHDEIERVYNPNVDFDGVYALVREHLEKLGLK